MTLIKIDETKCKKDAICVNECPAVIIRQDDKDSFPYMAPEAVKACLHCGHCVAVCPHDALQHEMVPMEESPEILKDLVVSQEQASQFLRTRRSIRRYKSKPVEKETIQYLIDQARYAPTGGNSQLLSWTVHTDEAKLKQMADLTIEWMKKAIAADKDKKLPPYFPLAVMGYEYGVNTITHNAPCLVVASAPGTYPNGMVDLTIALSYFELIAAASGLGTCWLGLIKGGLETYAPLQELVGLPEGHKHFYPMILGYPKFKYHRLPERNPARIFWK